MPEPTNVMDVPIAGEVSANETELAAKIDEQLGIKGPEVVIDETPEEDTGAAETNDDGSQEEVETPSTEADDEEVEIEIEKPKEIATPSDEDLFIEVLDADGVTHKISTISDLPDDFVPKNNVETLRIVSELAKLDVERERRTEQAQTDAQTAAIKEIETQQYNSWDKEIAELAKTKRIDVSNVDKVDKVFTYMNEVNQARIKAGNPNLVSSFEDALDKYEIQESKEAEAVAKKNGNDLAKQKAAMIGRSSASGSDGYRPYRAGSARNIDDVVV